MRLLLLACLASCPSVISSQLSSLIYDRFVIPEDKCVSVYLSQPHKNIKLFYLLQRDVSTLSITVTPCTTAVSWTLDYRDPNQTGKVDVTGSSERLSGEVALTDQQQRQVSPAKKGLYTIILNPEEEGIVEIFATYMLPASKVWPQGKMSARSGSSKGEIYFRWSRTTMDPDLTVYFLVVNKVQGGNAPITLCKVRDLQLNSTIVKRAGKKTSTLVRGLEAGEQYLAQVFALNIISNFTYKYAELPNISYKSPKSKFLLDGVTSTGELTTHQPTLTFKYKVKKNGLSHFDIEVSSCGKGNMSAEISQRGGDLEIKQFVKGQAILPVMSPLFGGVYILKLKLPSGRGHIHTQVIVHTEDLAIPERDELHVFRGLRGCGDVTLGFMPVLGEATYCLRASPSRADDILGKETDLCSLEHSVIHYTVLQCYKIHSAGRRVISQRLANLRPGKRYNIQIFVKKNNSRIYSYKLVQVQTSRCN